MHELTALLLALRLDGRQVALWLGDRLPMDVAGYQWLSGRGSTSGTRGRLPTTLRAMAVGDIIDSDWLSEHGID